MKYSLHSGVCVSLYVYWFVCVKCVCGWVSVGGWVGGSACVCVSVQVAGSVCG